MNRFQAALNRNNTLAPPLWLMRQAGRYHRHYQNLRKKHSFMDLCKNPTLACETTMGPIDTFNFDAAILFSDLLFPLEALGMGLNYDHGPPALKWYLKTKADLFRFRQANPKGLASHMCFQGDALRQIRKNLSSDKGLLGFVGGPFTLYVYAVEGSHKGDLVSARAGLKDGRFWGFCERICDIIAENMVLQSAGGADCIAIFDTAAGELEIKDFQEFVIPALKKVLERFENRCPVLYYSKGLSVEQWKQLADLPITALGIDWTHDLASVLSEFSSRFSIYGNVNPEWLRLASPILEAKLHQYYESITCLPSRFLEGWISGLGHGVLPDTPEDNVHLLVKINREIFGNG